LSDLRQALNASDQAHARFQTALAQYLGVRACKLASSGRTALFLLLRRLWVAADHPGRQEVLMPAYTCPALVKVVLDLGLRARFVDISPHTLAFENDHLAAHIGEETLAVICVHPFGIPQPVQDIRALAHAAGAVVIEDAAQAMGARLAGQPVGGMGDFGLFSLGPGKPLSTGGGGVLCTDQTDHARLLERAWEDLSQPSRAASLWALVRLALFMLAFHPLGWWLATRAGLQRVGDHEASWGYALRPLTQSQAAVGLTLLGRLDAVNQQRRQNAYRLIDRLGGLGFVHIPPPAATAEPIYLRLPTIISDEERRERLFRRLWGAGLGVGRMYRQPLPDLFPQNSAETYPGASYVARHLLTLPTHHYVTEKDVERITQIFQAERSTI
jgi:dTDP-4-amino-4,6-dideoxygalactose transaminase